MRKKLIPFDGGMAIVIDLPLLALIGAENAKELDMTTDDGHRLILSKIDSDAARTSGTMPNQGPTATAQKVDYGDPKISLTAIETLKYNHGFTQEHFRRLHHFGPKASLEKHIKYCQGTKHFTAETNAIVGARLVYCVKLRQEGKPWGAAIDSAIAKHPFP